MRYEIRVALAMLSGVAFTLMTLCTLAAAGVKFDVVYVMTWGGILGAAFTPLLGITGTIAAVAAMKK